MPCRGKSAHLLAYHKDCSFEEPTESDRTTWNEFQAENFHLFVWCEMIRFYSLMTALYEFCCSYLFLGRAYSAYMNERRFR